jgi:DNA-binding transcriptional regulator WhiA
MWYPSLSLRELGLKCRPPASKSAVQHRLRALVRLAAPLVGPLENGPFLLRGNA